MSVQQAVMHQMHTWAGKVHALVRQLVFLVWSAYLTYRNGPYYTMLELFRNYHLFGHRKLDYNVEFSESLQEKTCVITGGTRGIGLEVARFMFSKGCTVVTGTSTLSPDCTAQDIAKYKTDLLRQLLQVEHIDATTEARASARLLVLPLDLTSMSSVAEFSSQLKQIVNNVDYLICNGGVMFVPYGLTRDNFESHMSINYFGHCLLILKLMPLLSTVNPKSTTKSRIIVVSSGAHHASLGLRLHDLHSTELYSIYHGYAQSKLALVMFTYRFERWLQSKLNMRPRVNINCLHPGVCRTGLMEKFNFFKLKFIQETPLFRSASEGAETILYVTLASQENETSGQYFENCSVTHSSALSYDQTLQDELWSTTWKELKPWLEIDEMNQLDVISK